jgi:uncharacterized membrane protein
MKATIEHKPQAVYRWTAIAWLTGTSLHFIWSIVQQRSQPPTDEVYTQLLPFQIASFALTLLPYWVGGLLVALFIEFAICRGKTR